MFSLAGAPFTDPALRVARGRLGSARALFAIVIVFGVLGFGTPVLAEEVRWLAPVDAPVVDDFREPSTRFSAGNRGLEYGLNDSTEIRAVDDGRVSFAGRVGTELFVTIDHGGGLVSTLAYLDSIHVVRGQFVAVGDVVAAAGPGFHLTARLDGVYIDPAMLIAGVEIGLALIGGVAGPQGARQIDRAVGAGRIGRGRFDSVLALADTTESLRPSTLILETSEAALAWHHQDCTSIDGPVGIGSGGEVVELRPEDNGDRVLIQVGGLGSSSDEASIGKLDPLAVGYEPTEVKGFSYAGGCIIRPFGFDDPGLQLAGHAPNDYGPEDTYQSIDRSARRLADLIEATAIANPDATIDVAAHSLGGVVARRAVEVLDDRGRADVLGVVMTVGSPHAGADLATIASAAHGGLEAVDVFAPNVGHLRDAEAVIQLSEVGRHSIGPAPPPPQGLTVVAVAGSTDPIVTAQAAIWGGATNVLVNVSNPLTAHSELPANASVHDAFALALAGAAPACKGLGSVLAGSAAARAIAVAEDSAVIAAGVARWLL